MSLTDQEKKAYLLLFDKHKTALEASTELEKFGYRMSPEQLRQFKTTIYEKLGREQRQEFNMDSMLESFEKTRIMYDDAVQKLWDIVSRFEADDTRKDQPYIIIKALRELKDLIETGLKVQGKLHSQAMQIRAENINVINASDLNKAFKRIQSRWFKEMKAGMQGGKLVFSSPTPELVDDFLRWEAEELRKSKRIDAIGAR